MKRKRMPKMKALGSILLCAAMLFTMVLPASAGNLHPDGDAKNVAIETAGEGITLLKNDDNILPLSKEPNYPVFGQGSITHVPGGGGSGDMNIASASVHESVLEGMLQAGLKYDETTLGIYSEDLDPDWNNGGSSSAKAAEVALTAEQVADSKASSGSDTALYVLRRGSAEGGERNGTSVSEVIQGGSSRLSTRAASNYYLTDVEQANFDLICEEFDNVIVILNLTSVTDLSWMEEYPQIKGALCTYLPGSYGMVALGQILAGDVNPSGKLVDTWAKSLDDYPARAVETATFGTGVQNPVYGDDIYVGYRYFETFAPDRVLYEFGYGMSYTSFNINTVRTTTDEDDVTVIVRVTNTGDVAGKEVVQVYYSAPQGALGKPAKELGAYAKTKELAPGETQTLEISFKTNNMASYDDAGITDNKSCYVLEEGNYDIYVGNSVKNVTQVGRHNVPDLVVTEVLTEAMTPVANSQGTPFNRLTPVDNGDGTFTADISQEVPYLENFAALEARVQERRETDLDWVELTGEDKGIQYVDVLKEGVDPETGQYDWSDFMSQITMTDLVQIVGNNTNMGTNKTLDDLTDAQREELLAKYPNATASQITVQYYHTLTTVGSAGWFGTRGTETSNLEQFGIPTIATIDGPAGMRTTQNPGEDGNTWFQCGTLRAAMWNEELAEKIGREIGLEGLENNCDIWLAPGMNIHRDPLCGRNFEYYTEDPLLCGQHAAAETKGVQSAGQAVTLKHFAINSQETSRMGGNSQISERAIREIYIKGFEIAIKTSNPYAIMTSYNRINGSYAASNFDLCHTIARKEWNFTGMFMSDWGAGKDAVNNNYPGAFEGFSGNSLMIRADHDIWMAYGNTINRNGNTGGPEANTFDEDVYRLRINNGQVSYYTVDGNKYLFTLDEANNDTTGILRAIVNDQITMGEFQRAVVNIFNMMSKNIYYRTARWDIGLAEYTYDDTADFTTVNELPNVNSYLLEHAIAYADRIVAEGGLDNVIPAVVQKFNDALANAKYVLENGVTQEEFDEAAELLIEAIHYLDFKIADTTDLFNLVNLAGQYEANKDAYTPGSYANFEAALTAAREVLDDDELLAGVDDGRIQEALDNLYEAIFDLRYIPSKDRLSELLGQADAVNISLYTAGTIDVLEAAITLGNDVLANEDATEDDVAGAELALTNAMGGLKPIDTSAGSGGSGNVKDNDGAKANDNGADTKAGAGTVNPKTGESSVLFVIVVLAAAGLLTLALSKKKTK